jgi:NADPH2:quinone reductase
MQRSVSQPDAGGRYRCRSVLAARSSTDETWLTSAVTQRWVASARRAGRPEDVVEVAAEPIPPLGPGDALVRVEAAALNHSEVIALNGGHRAEGPIEGSTDRVHAGPADGFPLALGYEGAGIVVAAAPDAGMTVGTRVCWAAVVGSCADYVVAPASLLVPVPDSLTTEEAARVPSAGATAQLLARVWPLVGKTAVVWGAAGPVGRMLTAFLGDGGARVIGVAGGRHRTRPVAELDAAYVVDRATEDVAEAVRALTGGRGAAAVFDPVGAAIYDTNLAMLGRRGCLVNYGQLCGRLPGVDLMDLADKGLFLTTFGGGGAYLDALDELISLVARALRLALVRPSVVSEVGGRYGLIEAPDAYGALAAGPAGKVLVIPDLGTPG